MNYKQGQKAIAFSMGLPIPALRLFLAAQIACATAAFGITGTVERIVVQEATDSELDEAFIPNNALVRRSADPKDLRIGDGYTVGGIPLWNFNALTSPPSSFPHDIYLNQHHVRLNGSYSLNAEAGRLTAWYGTNAIVQIVAAASEADDVLLSVEAEGTNMAFTVAATNDDVTVEVCDDLANAVWESVEFVFERLTELTVKITVPAAAVGEMQYIRVLTDGGDVGMVVSIPLSVPSLTVGGAEVTAASISNWMEAFEWGDHATAGYLTGFTETDGVFAASAAYGITATDTQNWDEAYGWGNHAEAGYATGTPVYAETVENGVRERITLGSGSLSANPSCGGLLFGWPEESTHVYFKFTDGDVYFSPTGLLVEAWSYDNGTNVWKGRVNDTEATRITTLPKPATATNYFLRPDGGTNTISFDTSGNMIVAVDGTACMTILTNGYIGVNGSPNVSYPLRVTGQGYFTGASRASSFIDTGGGSVDPSGSSSIASLTTTGTLIFTNLPTATNGLASGTIWSDGGTLKVMP